MIGDAAEVLGTLPDVALLQRAQIGVADVLAGEHEVPCALERLRHDEPTEPMCGAVVDVVDTRLRLGRAEPRVVRRVRPRLIGLRLGATLGARRQVVAVARVAETGTWTKEHE